MSARKSLSVEEAPLSIQGKGPICYSSLQSYLYFMSVSLVAKCYLSFICLKASQGVSRRSEMGSWTAL
uniref:Uncharacterized protein n=1 Tax=Utricularia reniformis TaxID=192314 RepID=A0A1Y0B478_9LAMI|nr:hypothetical protein AEK19_MT2034 [Utricularia reniformis]ART32193.1 hypothetical protein AEK19_MT2034 [Utricularia reniformis]